MPKEEPIQVEGTAAESLPDARFWVAFENGRRVPAHVSGTMRTHFIRILSGDRVIREMSPYDLGKRRIVYRSINCDVSLSSLPRASRAAAEK